jgi:MFS family permease
MGIEFSWFSPAILILFGSFFVFLGFFFWWERRTADPMLDFSLFNSRVYNFSVLAALMQSLGLFAVNFLIVFYLQAVRGFDPLTAALMLIPLPLMSSIVAPLGGITADRIGARLPATVGLLLQAVALYWLSNLAIDTAYPEMAMALGLMGMGGGLFFSPNTSAAMSAAPKNRLGVASATLATFRQTGMVVSFALSLAVAAASLPHDVMMQIFIGTNVSLGSHIMQSFILGIRNAFLFSIVLCLLAAAISFSRGKEDRTPEAKPATVSSETTE